MPAEPRKLRDGNLSDHEGKVTNRTENSTLTGVESKKRLEKRVKLKALITAKSSELTYARIFREGN